MVAESALALLRCWILMVIQSHRRRSAYRSSDALVIVTRSTFPENSNQSTFARPVSDILGPLYVGGVQPMWWVISLSRQRALHRLSI